MPAKPIIAINPNTGERLQLINNAWVPMGNPSSEPPKINPDQFADAQASLEDLNGLNGRANWATTGTVGGLSSIIPGTPAYDLKASILPIQARGMLGKLMQLKQGSAQGASGLGALSDTEGQLLRSTIGNLDIGQSTNQFTDNVARAKQLIQRAYPGLSAETAIDLSKGQSRTTIPRGAYYKGRQGEIRRNDNFDAGNPIIPMGNMATQAKQRISNTDLKKKYGLE